MSYVLRHLGISLGRGVTKLLQILLWPLGALLLLLTGGSNRRQLDEALRRLGLSPAQPDSEAGPGAFVGELNSFPVLVVPRKATVYLFFREQTPLFLRFGAESPTYSSLVKFDAAAGKFNARFDTRFTFKESLDEAGEQADALFDDIVAFADDFAWQLNDIFVKPDGIACQLRHFPGIARLKPSLVEELLPRMQKLAETFHTAFRSSQDPVSTSPFAD